MTNTAERVVTTQAELDAALADPHADRVIIDSKPGVCLHVHSNGVSASLGTTTVIARGSSSIYAWDSASIFARGSASIYALGSASVDAWGSASVVAWDSARVVARDSASVVAWGSASVDASPWVAVHLYSTHATVTGGHVIDVSALDLEDPATWCAYHGVKVTDGIATVYKAVGDNWSTDRGTDYSPGSTPEAPDWQPHKQCGQGLHFSPTPAQSRSYYPQATRYLECAVVLADLVPLGDDKCKAPRVVRACVEVDIHGKRLS